MNTISQDKKIAALVAGALGFIFVISFIIASGQPASRYKLREGSFENSWPSYTSLLVRAYGGIPSPNDYYSDATLAEVERLDEQFCEDLRYARKDKFQADIEQSESNRVAATGAVLDSCIDQQQRALSWGLTEEDIRKFPVFTY